MIFPSSHAEDTELRVGNRRVQCGGKAQAQHHAGVGRVDDAVVPQARAGVVGVALVFVLLLDGLLEGRFFFRRPLAAAAFDTVALDGGQHGGGLLAAHDGNARVGPHPQEARRVGAAAHAVVAGAEAAADDDGELRHGGRGHGRDHLGAVAGDAFVLVFAAHHEAGDILQEDEGDLALAAQFDEVRALQRGLGEQDAVVGDDAHLHAVDMGEAAYQGGAVARLELVEFAAVDDAGDDFADVEGLPRIDGDHAVQLFRRELRLHRFTHGRLLGLLPVQVRHDGARQRQRVHVVLRQVVDDAGQARVHVAAAQVFRAHHFARGSLHQWRAAQEDGALLLDDDRFVAHGRHVGAAGRAGTHHDGDLRDALGRQVGLVVEDAAEVIAVGEDVVLVRQVGAPRIDQVDAGQVVLLGDFLGAQVLLDRDRVVGAALDGGVVTDDHAFLAGHAAHARDDAGRRCRVRAAGFLVHVVGGQLGKFEEGSAGIEQHLDAVARQQLAPGDVLGAGGFAAALGDLGHPGAQVVDQGLHGGRIGLEIFAARIELAFDVRHSVPFMAFLEILRPHRTSAVRRPAPGPARAGTG